MATLLKEINQRVCDTRLSSVPLCSTDCTAGTVMEMVEDFPGDSDYDDKPKQPFVLEMLQRSIIRVMPKPSQKLKQNLKPTTHHLYAISNHLATRVQQWHPEWQGRKLDVEHYITLMTLYGLLLENHQRMDKRSNNPTWMSDLDVLLLTCKIRSHMARYIELGHQLGSVQHEVGWELFTSANGDSIHDIAFTGTTSSITNILSSVIYWPQPSNVNEQKESHAYGFTSSPAATTVAGEDLMLDSDDDQTIEAEHISPLWLAIEQAQTLDSCTANICVSEPTKLMVPIAVDDILSLDNDRISLLDRLQSFMYHRQAGLIHENIMPTALYTEPVLWSKTMREMIQNGNGQEQVQLLPGDAARSTRVFIANCSAMFITLAESYAPEAWRTVVETEEQSTV